MSDPFFGRVKASQSEMTTGLSNTISHAALGQGIFKDQSPSKVKVIRLGYIDPQGCVVPLYEFDPFGGSMDIVAPGGDEHDAKDVVERAGLYPVEVEFNSVSVETTRFKISGDDIIVKGGMQRRIPIRKTSNEKDFETWFVEVCKLVEDSVIIVPDTNFIRRQYYSHHFQAICKQQQQIGFLLSRLSIMEIENKYNRNNKKLKDMLRKKKKEDEKEGPEQARREDQEKFNASMERRVGFHTMNEIIDMKRDGVEMLPVLDMEEIKLFTAPGGDDLSDALIRKDLLKNVKGKTTNDYQFNTGEPKTAKRFVFATGDKMNAMAATADDLNTLFISKPENLKQITLERGHSGPDIMGFCSLVINTAVHYGKCIFEIEQDSGHSLKWIISGDWTGKGTSDWQNEYVIIEPATSEPG